MSEHIGGHGPIAPAATRGVGGDQHPQLRVVRRSDRLALGGEIDMRSAPLLAQELRQHCAGRTHVVLDVRDVSFIDSSGLRVLLELNQHVETVTLVDPGGAVSRRLEVAALDEVFTILRT